MGDVVESCIILRVKEGVSAKDLINYAEIVSSVDLNGLDLTNLDIDSQPNLLPNDDTGGQYEDMPDCTTDPIVINDDNYDLGASTLGEDEDDHDPAWVHVFDLATIIYTDQTLPIIPGDKIKFNIELINQGNMATRDVEFEIYMPEGFELSDTDTNGWIDNGDVLNNTHNPVVLPDEIDTLCLELQLKPDFTLDDLIPVVEIISALDTFGNDRKDSDIDSKPNENPNDDEGGEIFSEDDDEFNENGKPGNDEDDHDPAVPPVLDLAIKIVTVDNTPKEVGDTVKFEITVYNQGSIVPEEFTIEDYVPEGLDFFVDPLNDGWEASGPKNATYLYTKDLLPLTSDTLCIYLILNEDAAPQTVVNMVEIIEVIDVQDRDISLLDIDSEADDSNENDKGNDLYSEEDNKIDENGRSGDDEDDHDQAFVNMCGEIAAISHVNVSLDEDCQVGLTASMLLVGDLFPNKLYTINVTDQSGHPHDPNLFSNIDLGKTFTVEICLPLCDDICTWNTITIEDKLKPTFMECVDDTISCVDDISVARLPVAEDNCDADVVLIDSEYIKMDCDSLFLGRYVRKYIAEDYAGNISEDTCTQIVYVLRTDFTGIVRPPHFMGANALECNSFAELPNGAPTVAVTQVPTLNGVPLYPFNQAVICNGFGKFEDVITFQSNCKTRITRTWTFGEWHCDSIKRVSFPQFIEIVDKVAPEVTAPKGFTVNVDGRNCEASVNLEPALLEDNCNDIVSVFVSSGSGDIINANGGPASLPLGINTIVYTATDACGNIGKDSMQIEVVEEQEPIAVCETFTTVSLDNTGLVWLDAASVDDGSFDECDDYITLEISRMNDLCGLNSTEWSDQVAFCCEDAYAGQNAMVMLRVTDKNNNSNTCMVEVEVQDKNKPSIICPLDMEVTCDFTFDPNLPAISFDSVIVTGTPCPSSYSIDDQIVANTLDQCRIGYLDREIIVTFNGSPLGVCNQRIEFVQDNPIDEKEIDWPEDVTITDMCSMLDLEPENLPSNADTPDVPDGSCNLVGVTKEDKTYPFAGNGACFKILRTWSVIDWCGRNGSSVDTIPEYTWVQTIYVQNLDAPVITSSEDTVFVESLAADCGSIPVELLASASDICTPVEELQWNYVVTLESGTEIPGIGNDASGTYPEGSHRVDFTVMDRCGNVSMTGFNFVIETKTKPVAVCYNSLSTALVPMDTSQTNPGPDAELSMLRPEMINNDSYHTCFGSDELVFSFDSIPGDTLLTLDCSNLGIENRIEMFVIDPNGNYNKCIATVMVIDTNDFDHCMPRIANIGGKISTYDDRNIKDVEVHLISNEDQVDVTLITGEYLFSDVPMDASYNIETDEKWR